MTATSTGFAPYLPRLVRTWRSAAGGATFRVIDGSLVGIDISGFTALSERLGARGKLGAEELILTISRCYDGLIERTLAHGGDVLKFRGDALLVFFDGDGHEARACRAAMEMQELIGRTGRTTSSVGPVDLRMAVGVNSGDCHFFLVGTSHQELVVAGPAASRTLQLEDLAQGGEVLVSTRTAEALPPGVVGIERGGAVLLPVDAEIAAPAPPASEHNDDEDLGAYIPAPLREPLASGAVEPEHRLATAAFVKFSGTDALVLDPAAAATALSELGRVVGEATSEFGVTWLESDIDVDGGKMYLVAGAPSSPGHDEERMLRAVRAIVDAGAGPPVSAGVNRGPVFAGEIGSSFRRTYAVMGDTVNVAARLTGRTKPGRFLASAEVLKRSRTRFDADSEPFLMKGKEQPINAFWIGAVHDAGDEAAAVLPLIGRDREVDVVRAAVDDARRRMERFVELVGEPGIGKSRLVGEARTLAIGFQQLSARSEEYESSTPFFAFRSLLRPLAGITPEASATEAGQLLAPWVAAVMPDLAPWLPLLAIPFDAVVDPTPETDEIDSGFRQRRLHEVLDQFLTRMLLMPTLLVFEDTHWMDDASRFFLRHLAAQPTPRPWLVLATRRPETEAAFGDPATVLELGPLDEEASSALALVAAGDTALAPAVIEELAARSGGNPLFVRELVAAGSDDRDTLPETVENVITTRIDRLDAGDRVLLRCAAVVGPSFDLEMLTEVLGSEVADVGDLERWVRLEEFVAWEGDGQLRFRHDLFRAVSYQGLSYRRRREVHARVGEALERRAGEVGEEVAGLLSLHFLEAGEFDKAWGYAVAAGDRAREKSANVDAAEFYDRALAAVTHLTPDPEETARVAEALGDVCELAARYERAVAAYETAARLMPGDPIVETRLLHKEGVLRERAGAYADALSYYARGLRALRGVDGGDALENRIELELACAGVRHRQGRFGDAIRWSRRAARHAQQAGNRPALAHAYYLLDIAHTRIGKPDRSFQALALPIYEELDDLLGKARLLNNAGTELHLAGQWYESLASYEEASDLARRAGDVITAASVDNNIAEVLTSQGRLGEAEARFEASRRVLRGAGHRMGVAVVMCGLGRVAAHAKRFEEAHQLLDEAAAELEAIESASLALEAKTLAVECFVLEGRHEQALQGAIALLDAAGQTVTRAQLERHLGYALLQARRSEEAREHFLESLRVAQEVEAEYELALTMRALADTGAPEYAPRAQKIFDRLGVVSHPLIPVP
jgi:class 3 adenylate cyclase/tetratricopeptide (TPR) repeat protein